jgi:hypothetical protein
MDDSCLQTPALTSHFVMAGLVQACPGHPRLWRNMKKDVDARHEAGHDG